MTAFEILYDLAIEIQVNQKFAPITAHHTASRDDAQEKVQTSINQFIMPGENVNSPWQVTRIFCRNLVNRAQAPITDAAMLDLLTLVERNCDQDEQRVRLLAPLADDVLTNARSRQILSALYKFTSAEGIPELANRQYLEWVRDRWLYWAQKGIDELDTDELIGDLDTLGKHQRTKISGVGFALAANFFADLGLSCFGKPDLHVLPIINLLQLDHGERKAFEGLIQIAKRDNQKLRRNDRFAWLGPLYPRKLDRIIYLIGSDNFSLNGTKKATYAPLRRDLMRKALIEGGLITSCYQT